MYLPRALARFNRVVTNPVQRRWAGVLPGYGIIEHVGRRSGRPYRTPVLCFRRGSSVVFVVGYGGQSDWLRNLLAAGGGGLQHRGRHYAMTSVAHLPAAEGRPLLPPPVRWLVTVAGAGDVVRASIAEG